MESIDRGALNGPQAVARSLDQWHDHQWLALDLIKGYNDTAIAAVEAIDRTALAMTSTQLLRDLFGFTACAYVSVPNGSRASEVISDDEVPALLAAYRALKQSGKLRVSLRAFPPRPRTLPDADGAILVAPVDFQNPQGHHIIALLSEGATWTGMRGRMMEFVLDQVHGHFEALHRVEQERARASALEVSVVEKEQQLEFQASHDQLTGLMTRESLLLRIDDELVRGRQLCIVAVGIRGFSRVNHRYGYAAADRVLKEIAHRLDTETRRGAFDALIARIADDRFALAMVLPDVDDFERANAHVGRLCATLGVGLTASSEHITLTAHAGVVLAPGDADKARHAVNAAELALDAADHAVGSPVIAFSGLEPGEKQDNSLKIESEINASLDNGHFELWFQPKIDMATEAVVGAEALMRWNHPELGRVSPVQFIPAAERSGQIHALGELALREACRHVSAWLDEGFKPGLISVNLSPVQVATPDLPDRFRAILEEEGVSAGTLELEVTETAVSRNIDVAARVISELHGLGFTVSIDDFGTGYSSLLLLRQLPIDVIKIDRAFIRDLTINRDDFAIVRAILSMADDLDLKVVAEGVETREQYGYLRALGCSQVQGAIATMPLAPKPFRNFVAGWQGLIDEV